MRPTASASPAFAASGEPESSSSAIAAESPKARHGVARFMCDSAASSTSGRQGAATSVGVSPM